MQAANPGYHECCAPSNVQSRVLEAATQIVARFQTQGKGRKRTGG
jgi:hypothetical protein